MFIVENETILHASRADVWDEVTNFSSYRRWNPFIRIEQLAAEDKKVQYSFRVNASKPTFYTVTARLLEFDTARSMIFGVGFRSILAIEEGYHLTSAADGVRLMHSFRCTGLLAALKLNKMKHNFAKMLEIMDRRFQQHLQEQKSVSSRTPTKKRTRRR